MNRHWLLGLVLLVAFAPHEFAKAIARQRRSSSSMAEERDSHGNVISVDDGLLDVATNGDASGAKRLLSKGADPNTTSKYKETPLHIAAYHGNAGIVRLLLMHGANVRNRTIAGATALEYAIIGGHLEIVRTLVRSGSSVNSKNLRGHTCLFVAVRVLPSRSISPNRERVVRKQIAEYLAKNGAKLDIYSAVSLGRIEVVKEMLRVRRSAVNRRSPTGQTPLLYAIAHDEQHIAALLLHNGADPNRTSSNGESALQSAAAHGRHRVLKKLLAGGAKLNYRDTNGETALHIAARFGEVEVVKVLLTRGADRKLQNADGKTPYDVSNIALKRYSQERHRKISKLLAE